MIPLEHVSALRTENGDASANLVLTLYHLETGGAEEPDAGKPHVRFCGGLGWVTAEPTRTTQNARLGSQGRVESFLGRMRSDPVLVQNVPWHSKLIL